MLHATKPCLWIAAFALGIAAASAKAADFELKFAHPLPPVHHHMRDVIPAWAKRIAAQTNGRVAVTQFPSGQLVRGPETFDAVRAGVADIGFVVTGFTPGRFPVMSIAELPFMFRTAKSGSIALMDLYATGATANELRGVKVLYLHILDISTIHMRSKQLRKPEDLKGLRVRFPSSPVKDLIAAYGGLPVGIPVGQIYENVEKGVVDGVTGGFDSMISLRVADIVKHHLDLPLYTLTFCICMNERKFMSLPADVQKAIMDQSGPAETIRVAESYDRASKEAYDYLAKNKHHIYKPTAEEEALWRKGAEPVIESNLKALEGKGIKAREHYRFLLDAAAKHEKM
jgi:TRAP-type C4-dicarboxylate transport system substrate-binding protein